ncbi:MAG: phosphatase PAP2 family protein [Candidatus Magasanikbacteria bacterium]
MKLSWSHKLFFKINKQIGKRPLWDTFMIFCARWLIRILVAIFAIWLFFSDQNIFYPEIVIGENGFLREQSFLQFFNIIFFFFVIIFSFLMNYIFALIWRRPRPIKEFPEINTLIHTMGTWKSFPSDHTISSVILLFGVFWFGMPLWAVFLFSLSVILIPFSRIFVGVHYPRDIVGGFVFALLGFLLSLGFVLLFNVNSFLTQLYLEYIL